MKAMVVTTVCLLLLGAAPFDPHPLDETQRTRLETAADGSATVDEAAFYALLENASNWSEKEAGAVVPDYQAIRRAPASWRGTRCLIEGTLLRVLKPVLGRQGWDKVEGAVIQVGVGKGKPGADDFVIVYLTDPPGWDWKDKERGLTWPSKVRVVGRFFKTSLFDTQGAQEKAYLTFVGRTFQAVGPQPEAAPQNYFFTGPVLIGLVVLTVMFMAWRVKILWGPRDGRASQMQDYIRQRRMERAAGGRAPAEPRVEAEQEIELPEDPADALDTLAQKHRGEED